MADLENDIRKEVKTIKPTAQDLVDKLLDSVGNYEALGTADLEYNKIAIRLLFKVQGFLIKRDSSR